jgi:hypothetical protein
MTLSASLVDFLFALGQRKPGMARSLARQIAEGFWVDMGPCVPPTGGYAPVPTQAGFNSPAAPMEQLRLGG